MSRIEALVVRLLASRYAGRALTTLAGASVPIFAADRFADRRPDPSHPHEPSPSPLVEEVEPRTCPPGVLGGDVVVKDQIDVAGMKTGVGMADGGELATTDAQVIARIVAAGGRILGKTKMTELGTDGIGAVMHYPMPHNPRAPGYIPGGSSTGTAVAVASGLSRYGVGGDGLGSIRIPAAFCGLVGLRPTRTRIPRDGIRSPVRSLDSVGPITRNVDDCALLWQVMVGEPITPVTASVPDRVGVPGFVRRVKVARAIRAAFDRALAALAVAVTEVEIEGFDGVTFLGGMTGAHELATGPYADRTRTATGRAGLALGRALGAGDVAQLVKQRDALRTQTLRVLEHTPILAMPTTAIPPLALSPDLLAGRTSFVVLRALGAFTPLANLVDLPAIAVPCGIDDRGRPLSIMFVGQPGAETALLQIGLAVERTGLGEAPIDVTSYGDRPSDRRTRARAVRSR